MAHDELGSKVGDKVKIVESRPISRHKRWVVEEIIRRTQVGEDTIIDEPELLESEVDEPEVEDVVVEE